MVKLTRIYTKAGDRGETALGDGSRVPKSDHRVEAYGTVDEANAAIGLVVTVMTAHDPDGTTDDIASQLELIQNDLFDVGADLSRPIEATERPGDALRVTPRQTERIEALIDRHNAGLAPLDSFVLPGGTAPAAHLHAARTVARRAERRVAALLEAQPETTNQQALVYLNRLGDLLFVLSRSANDRGEGDVLWVPGAGRSDDH